MKFLFVLILLLAPRAEAYPQASRGLISEFADWLLTLPGFRAPELDDPALYPATREFGPSVIPMNALPLETEVVTTSRTPWSSYWFPKREKELFDDGKGTSPLEKYDLVQATVKNRKSRAAEIERSRFRADVPGWEGHCDAWAIASLLVPEPARPRTLRLDGGHFDFRNKVLRFTVGDQKGLVLKTAEAISGDFLKVYGQKFDGGFRGWIYPDLFPQELHRFVEKQVFERREPFVMDHDPGVEIWNEPVYRAKMKIEAVPGRQDAVFVRLWLHSASPLRQAEKDFAGTKELAREYNYFLYGDRSGDALTVTSGVWHKGELVDSRRDHPDYVFTIPDPSVVVRASYNSEIDPGVVDLITGWKEESP